MCCCVIRHGYLTSGIPKTLLRRRTTQKSRRIPPSVSKMNLGLSMTLSKNSLKEGPRRTPFRSLATCTALSGIRRMPLKNVPSTLNTWLDDVKEQFEVQLSSSPATIDEGYHPPMIRIELKGNKSGQEVKSDDSIYSNSLKVSKPSL